MVKEGEFIDFAAAKDVKDNYSTEFQVVIELSKKVKEMLLELETLKARVEALEDTKEEP